MLKECKGSVAPFARRALAAAVVGYISANTALAQTSFASAGQVVIPVAANISVYHTQVFVRNPNAGPMTVNVLYYQSNDATPPAGLRSCAQVSLAAGQSANFDLGAQCGLNGVDDDFGMLVLEDAAPGMPNEFVAYSRTQTPDGIGFSVEGFPTDYFAAGPSDVLGLQRMAAAPNYRSNCFIGSLANPVNWQLQLVQSGSETVIGSTSGSLGAFQTTRLLDVFSVVGLAGDFSDVRATFSTSDAGQPAFVGSCTLETSSNGSADFRIAKSMTPAPVPPGPPTTPMGTWSGSVATLNANQATYIFVSPTAPVTLAATSTVTAYGSGWFARNTAGAVNISVGVCSQDQVGPGPVTLMGTASNASVSTTLVPVLATGSASLPASTYNVGLCAINNNAAAVNKSDATNGFVFVTP
jgi:hypothetical protein